jgi:hypothetical protein
MLSFLSRQICDARGNPEANVPCVVHYGGLRSRGWADGFDLLQNCTAGVARSP